MIQHITSSGKGRTIQVIQLSWQQSHSGATILRVAEEDFMSDQPSEPPDDDKKKKYEEEYMQVPLILLSRCQNMYH